MDNNDDDMTYGDIPVDDMTTDSDYHVNYHGISEIFNDESVDDFIANLNDWD